MGGSGSLRGNAPSSSASGRFWGGGGNPAGGRGPTKSNGGGGGLLGTLEHAAHVVASKASLAGHTLYTTPGGLAHEANVAVVQPWENLVTTGYPYAHGQGQKIDSLIKQTVDSTQ